MPITYEKIKSEVTKRNYRMGNFIETYVGMGEKGFKLSVDNETLKVSILQKISSQLKIPMAYWFAEDDAQIISEIQITYGDNPAIIIKELRDTLKECNDDKRRYKNQIDALEVTVGELKAQLSEKQGPSKRAV